MKVRSQDKIKPSFAWNQELKLQYHDRDLQKDDWRWRNPLFATAMMKPHTIPHTLLIRAALCPNPLEENSHTLLKQGMEWHNNFQKTSG